MFNLIRTLEFLSDISSCDILATRLRNYHEAENIFDGSAIQDDAKIWEK